MRIAVGIGSAIVLLLVVAFPLSSSPAQSPGRPTAVDPDFVGKLVLVQHSMGDSMGTVVLKNVGLKALGERTFLTGEIVAYDTELEETWKGVESMVPVAKVESLLVFDNLEQARKAVEAQAKAEKDKE